MSKRINQVEPNIADDDILSVNQYISSDSWVTEHKKTRELENQIGKFVGRKYSIASPKVSRIIYITQHTTEAQTETSST